MGKFSSCCHMWTAQVNIVGILFTAVAAVRHPHTYHDNPTGVCACVCVCCQQTGSARLLFVTHVDPQPCDWILIQQFSITNKPNHTDLVSVHELNHPPLLDTAATLSSNQGHVLSHCNVHTCSYPANQDAPRPAVYVRYHAPPSSLMSGTEQHKG